VAQVATKKQVRTRLEEERARLERVLAGLRADAETTGDAASISEQSSYDQHPADIGSEVFEHEKNQSLVDQVESELEEIVQAFQRLENGDYGICQACRKKIPAERLEAMPAARFCVEDQAKAERELGLPGVRS
jgi:RNA polymerase-binding transcription factor DksA